MTRLTAVFSSVFVMLAGSVASADTYDHFDHIAHDIERQATRLVSEVRHYRHTSQYRHLVNDAVAMARAARHAHVTAHIGADLRHLEADVQTLDRLLHHIESLVSAIEHDVVHGSGHIHGNAGHVHSLLHAMEVNIHHLQADLRSLRRPVHTLRTPVRSGYYTTPSFPSSGHGVHGVHNHGVHGGRSLNAISRRVPAGWGNRSLPRFRIGIGF